MPAPRPLSTIDCELRNIRTLDDDARRQLADVAAKISRGATVTEWAALCDLRDRPPLGIEARRGAVDRLLDERITHTREKAST